MSPTALVALVGEVAVALMRDPRVHPRRGDVLDDDPPLVPLTVVEVWPSEGVPRTVVAERREVRLGQGIVRGRWRGTLRQWRREMAGAPALTLAIQKKTSSTPRKKVHSAASQ